MPSGRPRARRIARLLDQLALRGRERRLAGVDLARGKLEHHAAHRIAELPLEHEASVVQHRHDQHGAGMHDELARRLAAVGQADAVAAHVEQLAREHDFGREAGLDQMRVVVVHSSVDAQSLATRKSV